MQTRTQLYRVRHGVIIKILPNQKPQLVHYYSAGRKQGAAVYVNFRQYFFL